ncbi:unnamed protein product [Euphydryas editha]|uniref:Uncharacterized protein n=1 Tax=Euphydryas editha TaxID=104508 RepID=A0AAU9TCK4_EUPED|nr:unnamed protein product [Euphydryas editha]
MLGASGRRYRRLLAKLSSRGENRVELRAGRRRMVNLLVDGSDHAQPPIEVAPQIPHRGTPLYVLDSERELTGKQSEWLPNIDGTPPLIQLLSQQIQ